MDKSKFWVKLVAAIVLIALVSASFFSLMFYLFR